MILRYLCEPNEAFISRDILYVSGCSDSSTTADLDLKGLNLGLVATATDGALCTAYGMSFDGVDDYVDLTDWSWGGTQSWEVYLKRTVLSSWSRVFEFSYQEGMACADRKFVDPVAVGAASGTDYGYSIPLLPLPPSLPPSPTYLPISLPPPSEHTPFSITKISSNNIII